MLSLSKTHSPCIGICVYIYIYVFFRMYISWPKVPPKGDLHQGTSKLKLDQRRALGNKGVRELMNFFFQAQPCVCGKSSHPH